jgi:hypothetical protein
MRSNLMESSAMALISISSVSMISASRIETLAWHMSAPGSLCDEPALEAIIEPGTTGTPPRRYQFISEAIRPWTAPGKRTEWALRPRAFRSDRRRDADLRGVMGNWQLFPSGRRSARARRQPFLVTDTLPVLRTERFALRLTFALTGDPDVI